MSYGVSGSFGDAAKKKKDNKSFFSYEDKKGMAPDVDVEFRQWRNTNPAALASYQPGPAPVRDEKKENSKALKSAFWGALLAAVTGNGDAAPGVAAGVLGGARQGAAARFKSKMESWEADRKRRQDAFNNADKMIRTDNQSENMGGRLGVSTFTAGQRARNDTRRWQEKDEDQEYRVGRFGFDREKHGDTVNHWNDTAVNRQREQDRGYEFKVGQEARRKEDRYRESSSDEADRLLRMASDPRTNYSTRMWAFEQWGNLRKRAGFGGVTVTGKPIVGPGGVGGRTPAEIENDKNSDASRAQQAEQAEKNRKATEARFIRSQATQRASQAETRRHNAAMEAKVAGGSTKAKEATVPDVDKGIRDVMGKVVALDAKIAKARQDQAKAAGGKTKFQMRWTPDNWGASDRALKAMGRERQLLSAEKTRLEGRRKELQGIKPNTPQAKAPAVPKRPDPKAPKYKSPKGGTNWELWGADFNAHQKKTGGQAIPNLSGEAIDAALRGEYDAKSKSGSATSGKTSSGRAFKVVK